MIDLRSCLGGVDPWQGAARRPTLFIADPRVWAKYQRRAKRLKKRPRDLAISDFYKGKNLLAKKTLMVLCLATGTVPFTALAVIHFWIAVKTLRV
jgi:hypothetical protein